MTIDELKPGVINHGVDAAWGKMFARLRLDEAEKSTADADLTRSPLAPTVDPALGDDCRRRGPPGPQFGGPHQHQAMWFSR
jgi:hypothetical protein